MRIPALLSLAFAVPLWSQSAITGTVIGNDGRPIEAALVSAVRLDNAIVRGAVTDARGGFRLAPLAPGFYGVAARKLGYRSAELTSVRLGDGQTLDVSVVLTAAPRQLSTIHVVTSPVSVDATTPELPSRLDRQFTALLPGGRTAASLVTLVPGARADQLWGGAPGASNNYQLDGVPVNHPGFGGDVLALSVDWIETLEVRGLGAGVEHGGFQGGIINAVTRSGSNERRSALRANYESARLTASNFGLDEQGVEQAGRRELGAEALGPIARDRLFYFVAGQLVRRDMRSPDLFTSAVDFQPVREEQLDARAIAKLTWLPALGQRVDVLGGYSDFGINHAGINGVDDPTATRRVRRPTLYSGFSWSNTGGIRDQFELRAGAFARRERRSGHAGPVTPGIHVLQPGRQPRSQNAEFGERADPGSMSLSLKWRGTRRRLTEHRLAAGVDVTRARWRYERLRNGGLTWRPYRTDTLTFDPRDVSTWEIVGSEWGGEVRLDSDVGGEAVFLQDEFALGPRLTVTAGVRYGSWSGYVRPPCDLAAGAAECRRFRTVRASGVDPRLGIAWEVSAPNMLAVKAHWGRYHQGLHALFFDRAAGVNAYSNQLFHRIGPPLGDSRTTFTTAQRDAPGSGFDPYPIASILDASGAVDGYRQPHVDQLVLAIEQRFGDSWKAELLYTNRTNSDIVGLVDRNLGANHTPISDVYVDNRYVRGAVVDPSGAPLVLQSVYVANIALQQHLMELNSRRQFPDSLFGYSTEYIRSLTWNPDVVLTTVPAARRRYDQVTLMLRVVHPGWRAEGSLTGARLRGNVPGITGYGTTATRFSAGPFVNPNEGINGYGYLPDALQMEGKVWAVARLPWALRGGFVYTHTLGERFTPAFEIHGQYAYRHGPFTPIPDELFRHAFGQSILLEPRGSRHYASRAVVDAHLEWQSPRGPVLTADLFNAFGEDEVVLVNTAIETQLATDPTTRFGAPRLRVGPRTLRLGMRIQ